MVDKNKYLINLPKVDKNNEVQRNSLIALQSFLPTDKFCLRDERIEDYGVDASLEILDKGNATNFRAQIQLKGTRSLNFNSDGSFSLQIETKNLNYLLNSSNSIYILYIEKSKEFRFIWALDEFKRLSSYKTEWSSQETVTLRFVTKLNESNLDEIRAKIIKQSVLSRQINETILMARSENIILEIDASTFEINDAENIKEFLLKKGITYCIAGYSEEILNKISLLESQERKKPKIQLIKAIAEFEKRFYQRAKETLLLIESKNEVLTDEEEVIKTFIKLHCDYETEKISNAEFVNELKILADNTKVSTPFHLRLSYLKNAVNAESDLKKRRKLIEELRIEFNKNITSISELNLIDLRNQLILLDIEGHQIAIEFLNEIGELLLGIAHGSYADFESVFLRHNKLCESIVEI